MERILWILTYLEQGLEFIVAILLHSFVDYLISNKVEAWNEMFEASTATKGHIDSKIQRNFP